ncbi:MAG: antibiotic biosynthesis monooxygenase [Polaribacter sp.]|jgi:heme-degrading monooxygenase HmoA|nr:antibiotic biosynthesis monooxygenase [Polaribacter sp.]MDB2571504.1 antibiotic biosynthesis monooxygenase [Polaribacter sp.]MDC1375080.1 antibiotic biosynthesis monooxygenase [Polaribacter sp.]MDG1245626.1 antibiotic biosynthesis monooxygenase [Polaribacter sp.]MDG1320640.1 antibiotic biosynthesis monooxygenase [Polaribacter sp.]
MIVDNLAPPYYAVIFSTISSENSDGYLEAAQRMEILAKQQKGFLGIESARADIGITVSYWQTLTDISAWKNNVEHTAVRELGREKWYKKYQLRICKVERAYGFEN